VAVTVTAAERNEVSGLLSVVELTMDAVGLQTGALAAGWLMTTTFGHRELDVFDIPLDAFTLTLQQQRHLAVLSPVSK